MLVQVLVLVLVQVQVKAYWHGSVVLASVRGALVRARSCVRRQPLQWMDKWLVV